MSKEAFREWKLHKKANLKTKDLQQARAELHQAIQFVGAVGRSYSPSSAEDEYGSLNWDDGGKMLVSVVVGKNQRIYAGMSLSRFDLGVYHEDGRPVDSINLKGLGSTEIVSWLKKVLGNVGLDEDMLTLELPYQIPDYKDVIGKKLKFKRKKVFAEFSKLYENAARVLDHYKSDYSEYAGAIKCWPHHFDIATQLIFSENSDMDNKNYVSLGFSPGDENYKRPYYYINLWPVPELSSQDLPAVGKGNWNTKGWFGATLDIKTIKKAEDEDQQAGMVKDFYDAAIREIFTLINFGA